MEMMAQYHSLILSPDQLSSVGTVGLIAAAAVWIFNLKSWLKRPKPMHQDDVLKNR